MATKTSTKAGIAFVIVAIMASGAHSKPGHHPTASLNSIHVPSVTAHTVYSGSATISYQAAEGYWIGAGGRRSVASTMAAIAQAESGLRPGAIQPDQPYRTTGWCLWQITPGDSEPQDGTDYALLNPRNCARAAVAKFDTQGLGAWTTYDDGAYRQFMQ